jgi:TPR repeat protein
MQAPSQKFRAQLARVTRGDTAAQAFVYSCHYFGIEGVTKDLALAFKFCRMAAEGGHIGCQINLGRFYSEGEGVEPDQRKAAAWYLRAAKEGGDADAQFYTVARYKEGKGHDAPNVKEAIKWYQAQGHAGAEYNLAFCYDEGNGLKMNPGLALKLWRRCAQHVHEAGYAAEEEGFDYVAAAHHGIGKCYCFGSNGLEKDLPMAMQWLAKATEQGCLTAQCVTGEIYLMGFLGEVVPVGTFDRDVPLGMKHLRAVTVAEPECDEDEEEKTYLEPKPCSVISTRSSRAWVAEAQRRASCATGRTARLPAEGAWTPAKPRRGTAVEPAS